MRFTRCLATLAALYASVSAQTISGLTFDGRDAVSLIWGVGGALTAPYDFYLCAGDESTGFYVSIVALKLSRDRIRPMVYSYTYTETGIPRTGH